MTPARRVVGVTVSIDTKGRWSRGRDYLYVARDYLRCVRDGGASPILVSPDLDPCEVSRLCDALVLTGGDDLPAFMWGDIQDPSASLENAERIAWERSLLDLFVGSGRRVLAICYGMQLLNVHLGGSLCQRLPLGAAPVSRTTTAGIAHGGCGEVVSHPIRVEPHSFLASLVGASATVSSSHRQAVASVAPGLRVCARAADGVIEAIEGDDVLGVQWHPEIDDTAEAVYRSLSLSGVSDGTGRAAALP
ncbi:MAG: gamma-glutamyl-gamma-aminobutyrate hydrolase family protein [Deltaproteobacteria bacterium]|nr:gamma-glutamyl-gamma-aminobutyrate hydrolase family protein [Deltaproteobacteria bacterium]